MLLQNSFISARFAESKQIINKQYCSGFYHVSQSDVWVVRELLHQGVIVCGEQRPTAQALRQLPHHCARNGRSVIGGCTPTCHNQNIGNINTEGLNQVL